MKNEITLADGSPMSWDQFSQLSDLEQQIAMSTGPLIAGLSSNHLHDELFPRMKAAALRHNLSEEDLLTFIRLMYDIIFSTSQLDSESGKKASRVNRPGRAPRAFQPKPVRTPKGDFPSLAAATEHYRARPGEIRSWIDKRKPGFSFI